MTRKATKAKELDKRGVLAALQDMARGFTSQAEAAREDLANERRARPVKGTRWKKHDAFLHRYEEQHVYEFLFWAWLGNGSDQVNVIRRRTASGEEHNRVVPTDEFSVEWVPATPKDAARQDKADRKVRASLARFEAKMARDDAKREAKRRKEGGA